MSSLPPLRAVTLDFWDTLYDGTTLPERPRIRREATARLLAAYGLTPSLEQLDALYHAAAHEADRWWREEHRGYTTEERIHWMLRRAGVEPREECEDVAEAVRAVDDALLMHPPALLPGAAECVRALAARYRLAIVSDTGFASGRAQDALLDRDGLRDCFVATVYSCDIGHAKPRPEPFLAALESVGVAPAEALHVGDIERTDVVGALGVGMRAVRLDAVRESGASAAEKVVRSLDELAAYLNCRD